MLDDVPHIFEDEKTPLDDIKDNLSEKALSYLVQLKDLQKQLVTEKLRVERLEMAIRGFKSALEEELKK